MKTLLSLAQSKPRTLAVGLMAITILGLLSLGILLDTQTLVESSYSWAVGIRVTAALCALALVKRLPRPIQTKALVILTLLIALNELSVFASVYFRG